MVSIKSSKFIMENERVKRVYTEIYKICREYGAEQVILFGSRAKGTAMMRSDIDIAVSGVRDFYDLEDKLEQIETLYSIDVVDMDNCKNEGLMSDIEQYGHELSKEI